MIQGIKALKANSINCEECILHEQIRREHKLLLIALFSILFAWILFFVLFVIDVTKIPAYVLIAISYIFYISLYYSQMITRRKIQKCQENALNILMRINCDDEPEDVRLIGLKIEKKKR